MLSEGFHKFASGRVNVKIVPSSNLDFILIIPPIAFTIQLLTVRLNPIPVDYECPLSSTFTNIENSNFIF